MVYRSPRVGVFPAAASGVRGRLFAGLASTCSIEFEEREQGDWGGLDGAIVFGSEADAVQAPVPCLVVDETDLDGQTRPIELTTADELDSRLRGLNLDEHHLAPGRGLHAQPGDSTLATSDGVPVWVRRCQTPARWVCVTAPREPGAGEGLRDQLRPGRFLGLLSVVAFLRSLTRRSAGQAGSLRACFVVDDPNLHAPRYGHIRYSNLLEHAGRHGYHISMASIPLDYWHVHGGTAELFRSGAEHLSLAVHGNNHERAELRRWCDSDTALATAAQALRRADTLAQRTGIPISRVMCAPHEEYSPAAVAALFQVGFDALVLDPRRDRDHATRTGLLGGWAPAQLLEGGLPVIPRYGFPADDDLAFRAYLGLPLIIYGHHGDLADGLDVLAATAARVNALGDVRWLSLGEIARTNWAAQHDGGRHAVQLFTRWADIPVPEGTEELVLELPPSGGEGEVRVECGGRTQTVLLHGSTPTSVRFVGPLAPTVRVAVMPVNPTRPTDVTPPRARLQPIMRRLLTEGRDRLSVGLPSGH